MQTGYSVNNNESNGKQMKMFLKNILTSDISFDYMIRKSVKHNQRYYFCTKCTQEAFTCSAQ